MTCWQRPEPLPPYPTYRTIPSNPDRSNSLRDRYRWFRRTGLLVTCLFDRVDSMDSGGQAQNPTFPIETHYSTSATGLEPATTGSTVRYSNQLSYAPLYQFLPGGSPAGAELL